MQRRQIEKIEHFIVPGNVSACWYALDGSEEAQLDITVPESLAGAVPKRRGSFRAGRACAAAALGGLGLQSPQYQFPAYGADRAPIWPEGICGSISHSDDIAIAMLAPAKIMRGLGVDIEVPVDPLQAEALAPQIYLPNEGAILAGTAWAGQQFTVIFSAKESIYKAIHPLIGRFIDFHEVTLVGYELDKLNFSIDSSLAKPLGVDNLDVSVTKWRDHVLTLCYMI